MPEHFEPAVAQGAERGVVTVVVRDVPVVELPGPAGPSEGAERPLLHGVSQVTVAGQPAGDDVFALPGSPGDRGLPGVACQCVRGIELLDVVTDFSGHPGGETVTQAREAQVDLAAGERLPRLFLRRRSGDLRGPPSSSSPIRFSQTRRCAPMASSWVAVNRMVSALARTR